MFARITTVAAVLVAALLTGSAFASAIVLEDSDAIVTAGEDRSTASTIWFQGFLADDVTGDPVNASYNVVARIYDAAGGGTLLWGPEAHAGVTITEGWFNIELGSVSPPLPGFDDPPYYLSLQVNGEYLTPRLKLASVPSAIQSATSDLPAVQRVLLGDGRRTRSPFTTSGTGSGETMSLGRSGGTDAAFTLYAWSDAPEAIFRGFQTNGSSAAASVLLADINSVGNDSPSSTAATAGAGPVYWGATNGLYGLEIYADASDAPADSVAHVIHAVYDGGLRSGSNVAVYGESIGCGRLGRRRASSSAPASVSSAARSPIRQAFSVLRSGRLLHGRERRAERRHLRDRERRGVEPRRRAFDGDVDVDGTLTKSAGSFRIDHPLDPANKYLSHSFVESPDMKNIYDGVVVLDGAGEALVELPDWFEALNQDFRYQLTCIGAFAPVYIAEQISGNRFTIAGGEPGMKVSWQLTGIRHDRYAEAHRIPVEEVKPAREQGKYRDPELYGAPATAGLRYDARMARERSAAASHRRERPEAPEGVDPAQQ